MRRIVFAMWIASAVGGPLVAQGIALAPGDAAPALTGVTHPVESRYEADWSRNEVTLVNFWATYCVPCRDEMPLLEEAYQRHKERGFEIVGPFERWETEGVKAFLSQTQVTYPLIRPDAAVDRAWGGLALRPTSFLVNREGRILRRYVGAQPEQTAGLLADIEAALDGQPLPAQVIPEKPAVSPEMEEEINKRKRKRPGG